MLSLGQNDALGESCTPFDPFSVPELIFPSLSTPFSHVVRADSIEKDFRNAKHWLEANDKNLRSIWTALQFVGLTPLSPSLADHSFVELPTN
jgi:hypothetical protein